MNDTAKVVMKFLDDNPEYKGSVVGWTLKRGLGISRIDNDWYECDQYMINILDLIEILDSKDHE